MNRRIVLTLLLLLAVAAVAAAAPPAKPVIKADKSYYDINSGLYVLKGHVYIEFRGQTITAGQARANMATMEIWGTDGVTLSYGDIQLAAAGVHVISSQNRALIEGDVTFKRPTTTITADVCDFNWGTRLSLFSRNVQVTQGDKTWSADTLTYNIDTGAMQ